MAIYVFKCTNEKCSNVGADVEVIVPTVFNTEQDSEKYVEEKKLTCTACGSPLHWNEWVRNSFKLNFAPFA